MALIKCPECGKEISDSAKNCPQCGYPLHTEEAENQDEQSNSKEEVKTIVVEKKSRHGCLTFILVAVAIILAIVICTPSSSELSDQPESFEQVTVNQMRDDLKSNEIKAQNTYKGKWFEITGRLGDMDSDGSYFNLEDEHFLYAYTVQCYIPSNNRKWLSNVLMTKHKGEKITVKGKITDMGESMGYEVTVVDIE